MITLVGAADESEDFLLWELQCALSESFIRFMLALEAYEEAYKETLRD